MEFEADARGIVVVVAPRSSRTTARCLRGGCRLRFSGLRWGSVSVGMLDWVSYAANGALLLAVVSIVYYGIRLGITPMPSSPSAVRTILGLIPDSTEGKIVDLGSGWGSLAYPISARFADAEVVGYELSPIPWLYSRLKGVFVRRGNLELHRRNVFEADLRDVDVVVVFLHPAAMRKLRVKFERELRPGCLVLSNTFAVPRWEASETRRLSGSWFSTSTAIYVYRV